jgi:hypothetical protein
LVYLDLIATANGDRRRRQDGTGISHAIGDNDDYGAGGEKLFQHS